MGQQTKIEWCDHSWSPWRGCTKVSPGCANCYAETLSKRNPAVLGQWGRGKPRVLAKNWKDPVKWNAKFIEEYNEQVEEYDIALDKPTVFPSLCDWLDPEVPVEWLARFLKLIHDTPNLNWLLLTKRPELWVKRMAEVEEDLIRIGGAELMHWRHKWTHSGCYPGAEVPANVWVGTSVEDQQRADERIPALLKIPAVGRFLSVEPLLGPVDLAASVKAKEACPRCTPPTDPVCPYCLGTGGVPIFHNGAIHWVIIGGESGHGSRPCNVDWVRSVVRQCKTGVIPCFVKQVGAVPVDRNDYGFEGDSGPDGWPVDTDTQDDQEPGQYQGKLIRVRVKHLKGGDPSEWPQAIRVRQRPEGLR